MANTILTPTSSDQGTFARVGSPTRVAPKRVQPRITEPRRWDSAVSTVQKDDKTSRSETRHFAGSKVAFEPPLRLSSMKKWNGRITEVDEAAGIFTAELSSREDEPVVLADFEISELGERKSPDVGDVIYVTVTSSLTPSGYPKRTATVRLRRIGLWTADDVASHWARGTRRLEELRKLMRRNDS